MVAVPSLRGTLSPPSIVPVGGSFLPQSIPSLGGPLLTPPIPNAREGRESNLVRDAGGLQLECGVSLGAEDRILGGDDAGVGQFPWTALLQIRGQYLDKMCAGTLFGLR